VALEGGEGKNKVVVEREGERQKMEGREGKVK
jgi:hypothetical protein